MESLKLTGFGVVSGIYKLANLEKLIAKTELARLKGELVSDHRLVEAMAKRDIGKGIIGMLSIGFGILLSLSGIVKIEDDDDKTYIIVGDAKVDISNIFGTSSVLVGISLAQIGKESFDDILADAAENLFEGFFLKDMLERQRWNKGTWEAILTETESVMRSIVPQLVQLIIRTTNNEKIKYSSGTKGMFERWLNSFVPTQPLGERKINPYTGEVETKYATAFWGELFKGGLIGPKIWWSKKDELEVLARAYGVNKLELTGEITVNGTKKIT